MGRRSGRDPPGVHAALKPPKWQMVIGVSGEVDFRSMTVNGRLQDKRAFLIFK
jgi:hypothetical protein